MITFSDQLTSDRIRLIAIDAERDGDLMARWSKDAGMMRLFDSDVPRPRVARQSRADTEKWAYRDTAIEWAIQVIDGGAVIGRIGLHRYRTSHRAADLHVGIGDRAHWSKGYGREAVTLLLNHAFGEMDLHRVGLIVFAANERAVALYRKLGFVEEGRWRQFLRRDGADQDILVMGLLRHEWPPAIAQVHRIHHVQVCVSSAELERARAFYLDLLGLPEIHKPESLKDRGGFWAEVGGQQLHVSTEEGVDRTRTKAHIAWQVRALSDWRAKLEAAGCATLDSIPIPGYDRFEARDPFGNRIEFIQAVAG
ncbi:MAG TPA: GNAT family N-acetyltransferase [Thermoflexales bacterium]|jgi:RimJ/RimL family protein N-acetyltransferase/catechol 2,3-dioxygenase-like lactoylglutathione lyase family enzyme|nr:GNAT family N-acetyltransferase [Thermoflexales bacterium]HQZ53591.1 GNAT family N-acetyltransferase [Thermoflexales bacterium]